MVETEGEAISLCRILEQLVIHSLEEHGRFLVGILVLDDDRMHGLRVVYVKHGLLQDKSALRRMSRRTDVRTPKNVRSFTTGPYSCHSDLWKDRARVPNMSFVLPTTPKTLVIMVNSIDYTPNIPTSHDFGFGPGTLSNDEGKRWRTRSHTAHATAAPKAPPRSRDNIGIWRSTPDSDLEVVLWAAGREVRACNRDALSNMYSVA